MKRFFLVVGVLIVVGGISGAVLYHFYPNQLSLIGGITRNTLLTLSAPEGTTNTETNPTYKATVAAAPVTGSEASPDTTADDWPSYNRTLTSHRYSSLSQINTNNVGKLKVLCTYDVDEYTAFESGLLMVDNALIGTTHTDIFSLDAATCAENWRTHEDLPAAVLPANRGAAYWDGMLFRGDRQGQVLAYDFKTGKRLWKTVIANPVLGEAAPSAPIVWNGLVFIGNSGGDYKGGKGHMYALDAKTGKIAWQFYLAPRTENDPPRGPVAASPLDTATWHNDPGIPITGGGTWTSYTLDPETGLLYVPGGNPAPDFIAGAREGENLFTDSVIVLDAMTGDYQKHFKIVPKDWHDWDVSNPPILNRTAGGRHLMSVAPKDGHLYGFDLATDELLYRVPATRIENATVPYTRDKSVFFCPGSAGGAEWNSPAYDPRTNLVLVGEMEWCTTVRPQDEQDLRDLPMGQPWMGMATFNPFDMLGKFEKADSDWAGWVYAVDADTGVWKWRLKSNYPIVSGMTPTAGGVVFFGDLGGNFYALDAVTGEKLLWKDLDGAIAGGVITYTAADVQKVAVAAGFVSIAMPSKFRKAKVVVLGLEGDSQ